MPSVKISELPPTTSLDAAAVFPVTNGTTTEKVTVVNATKSIHASNYGVVADGATDDTAAVVDAIAAAISTGYTLRVSGTPLISSKLTIGTRIHIVFDGGNGINAAARPASYFIKKSTMTTTCVEITGSGTIWEGGGVLAQAGNTGDNITIKSNGVTLRNVYSELAGGSGIVIDSRSGVNANSWRLDRCQVYGNTSHGFQIRADSVPNSNAGLAVGCVALSNGGDGFNSVEYASWNVFQGCLSESNTGYGIRFNNGYSNMWSGDVEANTIANINIESRERRFELLMRNNSVTVTDSGFYTARLDRYVETRGTFTPALRGATGTTKIATAFTISGTTAVVTSVAHGYSSGDTVFHISSFGNENMHGAFVISGVTLDDYTITFRTDQEYTLPVTSTGLAGVIQRCGASSVALGRYTRRAGTVECYGQLTMSAVTNITGSVQLILPFATANISASLFVPVLIGMHSGITYTGLLTARIQLNGGAVAGLVDTVSGAPGTPAALQGTGLAAATDILFYMQYLIAEEA